MNWKEIEEDRPYNETWVCGEPNLGCGVYKIGQEWKGVVVIFDEKYKMPAKPTKIEAIIAAEECFGRLYEQYHEIVN